ncbi:hypothetical protein LY474_08645 [Myxococcus stipitatus]|uniref:hypothetical protein n=1 Tax=Myxococcus stipitatus TaxID=83455 RepID=UPI001F32EA28|nr:hypothetical protein [Myxococcus stipitatus]MCE9667876.1 hypothetical protein [Myxococcus stipitatus]
MKWLIGGVVVAMFGVACGGSEGPPVDRVDEAEKDIECSSFTLRFEEFYGFCYEDCLGKLVVSSDGSATAARADYLGQPETTRDFTLTAEELVAVRSALQTGISQPWDAQYGCPDCYDQGRYSLVYESCGQPQTTLVDPEKQPETLQPLFAKLRDLLRANEP